MDVNFVNGAPKVQACHLDTRNNSKKYYDFQTHIKCIKSIQTSLYCICKKRGQSISKTRVFVIKREPQCKFSGRRQTSPWPDRQREIFQIFLGGVNDYRACLPHTTCLSYSAGRSRRGFASNGSYDGTTALGDSGGGDSV